MVIQQFLTSFTVISFVLFLKNFKYSFFSQGWNRLVLITGNRWAWLRTNETSSHFKFSNTSLKEVPVTFLKLKYMIGYFPNRFTIRFRLPIFSVGNTLVVLPI
uniref:Uncharacterized protein n=1 Tax=Cacopsylla melanoneura TaxID=428564 RepID=A0A8D9F959_9HEMI